MFDGEDGIELKTQMLAFIHTGCGHYCAVEKQHAAIYGNARLADLSLTVIAYTRGLINVPRITDFFFSLKKNRELLIAGYNQPE